MIIPHMQQRAMVRSRGNGEPFCLIENAEGEIILLSEVEVIECGMAFVDAIIWTTDFAEDEAIDPALLA
ncbi:MULTISPECIES: hypothetical protein [Sphingobium]|uniref:hypothetical protein n=1 Tax=Sphingobium TaxID=165695 RepID=UPI0007703E8B|nr:MULTISPECIES: hypothetical protein [unclassified Sphingobium]AMK25793.1 hypothetical protein K426_24449 [Sphingobium sp. TKS]MEC6701407.1 hypothetical protein [Sphingobium sp. SJ10-10]NML87739.1 hypothetical protein [Sphingobium sp. TB-6]PNQ04345.1 hypothetical protein A8G00_01790 [Sphingobium sp. SA916]